MHTCSSAGSLVFLSLIFCDFLRSRMQYFMKKKRTPICSAYLSIMYHYDYMTLAKRNQCIFYVDLLLLLLDSVSGQRQFFLLDQLQRQCRNWTPIPRHSQCWTFYYREWDAFIDTHRRKLLFFIIIIGARWIYHLQSINLLNYYTLTLYWLDLPCAAHVRCVDDFIFRRDIAH